MFYYMRTWNSRCFKTMIVPIGYGGMSVCSLVTKECTVYAHWLLKNGQCMFIGY